jgi:hypothetical protein
MRYFCTYFDFGYFTRGIALYESLRQHCPAFTLWVLCLDKVSLDELKRRNLPSVKLVSPEELEDATEGLAEARSNRSQVEYYFTCSPALPLFILKTAPQVDLITYLDSDLYFYANPEPVFEELGTGSIGIIRHRVKSDLAVVEQYGIYNVGWVSFRRDEDALACLRWWRDRCIEWCFHRVEENRYADQKYLDSFPKKFRNVVVLEHKGANLAPWNIANYRISKESGKITVDRQPLLFFHFQGFNQINRNSYATGMGIYNIRVDRRVLRALFEPYIRTLLRLAPRGIIPAGFVYNRRRGGPLWKRLLRPVRNLPHTMDEYLTGARVFCLFGRIF